jgi:hypothetical protein
VIICPACGRNEIDTPSGFCSTCVVARASANYAANDRSLRDERSREWRVRTTDTTAVRWDALRQQRRRQIRRVRPLRPAASLDPWTLAIDALSICRRVAHSRPASRSELDEVMEVIRRLAWGPDDGEVWIEKSPPKHRRQIAGQLVLFELVEVVVAA